MIGFVDAHAELQLAGEDVDQAGVSTPLRVVILDGHAFAAGVLYGWHESVPVREQLRIGVCAAAANLSEETCTDGLRPMKDCLALGEKFGFRE